MDQVEGITEGTEGESDTSTEIETQGTGVESDTAESDPVKDEGLEASEESATQDAKSKQQAAPFSNGKEKFKVSGKEYEWDWETTKKYAQLGLAGQKALETAANTRKKANTLFSELQKTAETDPDSVIEFLTGKRADKFSKNLKAKKPAESTETEGDDLDNPLVSKINELEQKLKKFEEKDEQSLIENERKAVETELEAAVEKYPALNKPYLRHYVKSQYKKLLESDVFDVSIEDVAFQINQELEQEKQANVQGRVAKIQEKRKAAPLVTTPSGGGAKKPMSREEVYKMAGISAE